MRLCITALVSLWAALSLAAPVSAQAPGDPPRTPVEIFQGARDLIAAGRYDQAAEELKRFLAANPTDNDLLELQRRDATVFLQLRNVATWSDEPAYNAEAKKTVEDIIRRSEAANAKLHRDPARILRFVRNLGATLEERLYAEQELIKGGDAVVPVMVEVLRTTSDVEQRAGILLAINKLGSETVPGFLAALDGLNADLKLGILRAVATRGDVLNLLSAAETDFSPYLWYYSGSKGDDSKPLRDFAFTFLEQFAGKRADRVKPEDELVRIGATFPAHQARFRGRDAITVWSWDPSKVNVVKATATRPQAEDYYALRYVKWALDLNPNHEGAQDLFLNVSVSRAVERARFRDLAEADPNLYQVLAAVPSAKLNEQAALALSRKQTAYALGLINVLAARADKTAATATEGGRLGVFLRGLDYPDARVQLASAVGLLRSPVPPTHGKTARVVEVLRRAVTVDPAGKETGRALIADPVLSRATKTSDYLQQLGYVSERLATGRDLLRRVNRAADYDLIVVDRHVVDPVLVDLLPQLQASLNVGRRPVLVVASSDRPRPLPFEHLLLRLALLVGVTEEPLKSLNGDEQPVPPPFAFDPRVIVKDVDVAKAEIALRRDRLLAQMYEVRLARLKRLVAAAGLPYSKGLEIRLDLRLPQLTYIALAMQYPITLESSPEMYRRSAAQNTVILNQPALATPLDGLPVATLNTFAERLETGLSDEERKRFDAALARVDTAALGFPPDNLRDLELEERLANLAAPYPIASVIPEPFGMAAFTEDVQAALDDPAELPRDPEERKRAAAVAIEWLRRLAVGEVQGYDIRPAEPTLREALKSDDLAPAALEALARISTAEAQQDMVNLAVTGGRPEPLRSRAAGLAIQHIQNHGKLTPKNLIDATTRAPAQTNELRAKLLVIYQLLAGKPGDLGGLMSRYPVPTPLPPPPPPPQKGPEAPKEPEPPKNP